VASAVWDASAAVRIEAGDNQARDALDRWSLMRDE
jgi:hypothetical protein